MTGQDSRVVSIDPTNPSTHVLRMAADVLRAGGLVAFPTETVYGLGANALDADAVARIYVAKGRPPINPLIVHVNGDEMLRRVVGNWPPMAETLATRFWPGPLTFVLWKGDSVPEVVTAGGKTVAVRNPGHPVALGLIREAGVPLAAPSANRSGQLSPTRAEHVVAGLNGRIDLILDGGPTANGIESTVLDLTAEIPTLLRPGPISLAALESVVGPIRQRAETASGPLASPGMMPRHYAPRTPIELHPSRVSLNARADELRKQGATFSVVLLGIKSSEEPSRVSLIADPVEYGARLYEVLHCLDALGLSRILIELPPETDDWLAVRDRLFRAAAD